MKWIAVLASLFIIIPIVEFAVLIEIGRSIGTVYTLALVFGAGLLGAFLARQEGMRIIYRIQRDLQEGRVPTEQLLDGLLVLIAAVFLITPGFLSDVFGMSLLFPPTRYPFKRYLKRIARNWIGTRTRTLRIVT